jgi:hypothetical protein
MTDGSIDADSLAPESYAVLAMARDDGRGYDEIATVLKLDPAVVRDRAHALADELVGDSAPSPPAEARRRIVDYLLGQQPASDRARTRAMLEGSKLARTWSEALDAALAARATDVAHEPEPQPAPQPESPTEPELRAQPEAKRPGPEHGPEVQEPAVAPAAASPRGPARSVRAIRTAGALLVATAVVAVVLALISGSGAHKQAGATTRSGRARGARSAKTLQRLVLQATSRGHGAIGAGAVIAQGSSTLLLLQARGLAPNRQNAYAVWLYNTPVDSRLLGFISPAVGPAGTFSSGTPLPDDAVRFGQVLITVETSARPRRPGKVVLHTSLSLG